jgi:hypothetical protein
LHNLLLLCIRAGALLSTPVSRRLVCCTPPPLSTPLHSPVSTALSSLLPCFRSPRDPKSTERGRKRKRRGSTVQERQDPPPGLSQTPPLISSLFSGGADLEFRRRRWAPDLCSRSSPTTSTSLQGQSVSHCSALFSPPSFIY